MPNPNAPVHPARLDEQELRTACSTQRLRRSGPGGQHRNKVETAVVVTHLPTGVAAEANERRSQTQNLKVAVARLRVRLALEIRTPAEECAASYPSQLWRGRLEGSRLAVSRDHADYPALLAESLDVLAAHSWDDRQAAEQLSISRTQLVRLLKTEPQALAQLNTQRTAKGLSELR